MNRPKKNKDTNPTLPKNAGVDERNLIDTEESDDISIEDRIHLYWMENKGFITGCVLVLALAIIGINGMRIYKSHAESSIQLAYANARAESTLANFAQEYDDTTLGGFAALSVADDHYAAGDYAPAIEYYEIAVEALNHDLLDGRAQLGLAFAIFRNGDASKGLALLEALADDADIPEPIRQEAAYHLAIEADVDGDTEAFKKYSMQLTESGVGGPWQQRMQLYQQQR